MTGMAGFGPCPRCGAVPTPDILVSEAQTPEQLADPWYIPPMIMKCPCGLEIRGRFREIAAKWNGSPAERRAFCDNPSCPDPRPVKKGGGIWTCLTCHSVWRVV